MFVKFDCGCVGIMDMSGTQVTGNPVIFRVCDADTNRDLHEPLCCVRREMHGKTYKKLSAIEESEFIKGLDIRLSEGYAFRELRSVLMIPDRG
jgi:hypothetical protein